LREFLFIEREKSKWYYIIEDEDAPMMAWRWTDYAIAYGPFMSFDEAANNFTCFHKMEPFDETVMSNNHYSKLSSHQKEPYVGLMDSASHYD